MNMMLIQLAILVVGLVPVSALVYICLRLYARYHPGSELAKPRGVRDVWQCVNGEFYSIALIGLISACMDISMGAQESDIGFFWLISLVGGLWLGVQISILIASIIGRRRPDSIIANPTNRRLMLYGLLAVSVSLGALIILLFWLAAK